MSLVGHIPFYFPSKTSFFLIKISVERIVLWVLSSPPPLRSILGFLPGVSAIIRFFTES